MYICLTARVTRGSFLDVQCKNLVGFLTTSLGSVLGRIMGLDIKITRPNYMSSTKGTFRLKDTNKSKVKDGKIYIMKIATTRKHQWLY